MMVSIYKGLFSWEAVRSVFNKMEITVERTLFVHIIANFAAFVAMKKKHVEIYKVNNRLVVTFNPVLTYLFLFYQKPRR